MRSCRNKKIEGVGISLPGRFNQNSDRLVFAPNLKWRDVDLRNPIVKATGLEELQTKRREYYKTQMDDAIRLSKTKKMKGLPYDAAQDGFVYAPAEIGHEHDRRHMSKTAEQVGFDLTKYEARFTQPEKEAA